MAIRQAAIKLITGTEFRIVKIVEDNIIQIGYQRSNKKYFVHECDSMTGKATNTEFERCADAVDYFIKISED